MGNSDLVVALERNPIDRAFVGERFRVVLRDSDESVAIASVGFIKQGFVVHLSYFEPLHGLLGRYSPHFGDGFSAHVELENTGRTTTKKIKYSHPRDGNAHFSQDRQVFSEIRTESAHLALHSGHMFSIMVRGLDAFNAGKKPSRNPSVQSLEFELPNATTSVAKITGFWYPERSLRVERYAPEYSREPGLTHFRDPDGTIRDGYIVRPPRQSPWRGYCICLVGSAVALPSENEDPFFLFLGGFNVEAYRPGGIDEPASFLVALYTDRSATFDELQTRLGSIDFK